MTDRTSGTPRLRWGIAGLGNIVGAKIIPAIRSSHSGTLAACVARSDASRTMADKAGIARRHPTLEAMLNDTEVDAVYIATPNSLHKEHAIAALQAGKHVLCEKPLALEIADARAIQAAAHAAGRTLRVAYQFRFETLFQRMRTIIRDGTLGELRSATLTACSPVGPNRSWRAAPEEGGVLSDLGVHYLDLLPWLCGMPWRRIAAATHPGPTSGQPIQTLSLLGELGDACQATLRISRELPHGSNMLTIEGLRGRLECDAIRWVKTHTLRVLADSGSQVEEIAANDAFLAEIEAFHEAVLGRPTALADADDGIAVACATAAVHAYLERRPADLAFSPEGAAS